jgi:hypothetical protein
MTRWTALGIVLVSAGTLSFEISLTRLFAVAQGYHFGFLAVSVGLLGFGASGSLLTALPSLGREPLNRRLSWLSLGFAWGVLASYLAINYLPFDAYRLAWEPVQWLYLALYYGALTVPFIFSGLVVGALLATRPTSASRIYAANLAGSGLGCLVPLVALPELTGPGAVLAAAALGAAGTLALTLDVSGVGRDQPSPATHHLPHITPSILALLSGASLLALGLAHPPLINLRLSPYKSLSQVLRYPDARLLFSAWNAISRVDVVESSAIRSAPGLSFGYQGHLPRQAGLLIDGEDLSPVTDTSDVGALAFLDSLPQAGAYRLASAPRVLVIEPRGGLDVLLALRHGAASVTAVEGNPLVINAARRAGDQAYTDPRVQIVLEDGRSFARRPGARYDLVVLALDDSFRPANFGAFSLAENYLLTVESFEDLVRRLTDGGFLVVSRWLQLPPSEEVRAAGIAIEALRRLGVAQPGDDIAAYRSFQTMTLLVKRGPLTEADLAALRAFCAEQRFDLVYLPGMAPGEANHYNVLSEPLYFDAFQRLLSANSRQFIAGYPYDIVPPTDDRPFFFHLFRWSQVPLLLRVLGKTWQPFGGGGYLILVALLGLVSLASLVLIVLPLGLKFGHAGRSEASRSRQTRSFASLRMTEEETERIQDGSHGIRWRVLAYFGALGIGYLFVEIPLMQRFIVLLGQPVYAFAVVLCGLLTFSGLGSWLAPRLPLRPTLVVLVGLILVYPAGLPLAFQGLLSLPLAARGLGALALLAPVGLLLGVPFPGGVALFARRAPDLIAWAWAVNGCLSVVSSVLAAMVAVTAGFSAVLAGAALAYGLALLATSGEG